MERLDDIIGMGVILMAGAAMGAFGYECFNPKSIPYSREVQSPFIEPSRIKFKYTDKDGHSGKESYLVIDDVDYALTIDNGEPKLSRVTFQPAEINIE